MTSAAIDTAGPVEDARRSHDRSLDALQGARAHLAVVARHRQSGRPDTAARLTAAETAAHVVGDLRDYTTALTRHRNGYMTHANPPMESPSKLSAKVNARHLEEVPERNPHRLADLLESRTGLSRGGRVRRSVGGHRYSERPCPGPSTMTCLLLGDNSCTDSTSRAPRTCPGRSATPMRYSSSLAC